MAAGYRFIASYSTDSKVRMCMTDHKGCEEAAKLRRALGGTSLSQSPLWFYCLITHQTIEFLRVLTMELRGFSDERTDEHQKKSSDDHSKLSKIIQQRAGQTRGGWRLHITTRRLGVVIMLVDLSQKVANTIFGYSVGEICSTSSHLRRCHDKASINQGGDGTIQCHTIPLEELDGEACKAMEEHLKAYT
uniref:Uncharacterized protein n=1 Tax=Oryza sativa subsp. japonica TaxID=39947 RepID=Q6EQV1_ORYSJ|nr:hypothetical protein [Oryza sativa Japonica Group]